MSSVKVAESDAATATAGSGTKSGAATARGNCGSVGDWTSVFASVFGVGFASAGIANAAIGVTKIVNARKNAIKTLKLLGVVVIDRYMGAP
jgi:hypothetical protein